ncbi:histidine acid phosphatase-like protein [Mollisia scopiformis]|uniref:Histidine acid phosphatase-like protein n=1 Tax=Mollisia scopiformis TaxID=149040 RepID=A0A194WUN2_MOLSC|nr:histidine acid phosphatase-like protein [Mollisia scopiformis]KUJ11322.1 histidine acid phosphatase-like protein [Mollisia scopiformis]
MVAFHFQVLVLALLPLIEASETILGAFIFSRHGDRSTKSYPPTHLTDLGYQQIYQSGGFYRNRYITNGSTQIYGISTDLVKLSQLEVQTAVDDVLQSCATGFLQGLYPPVGATLGSQTLANGTSVEAPFNGYQIVPVNALASAVDNSGDATWLQGASGCVNAVAASNNYFFSSDYKTLSSSTASFYQSILPVINNTFTAATAIYKNAYAIWDLVQVSMIHNATIQSSDLLTPANVLQLETLANHHEFSLAYNASNSLVAIAGSVLASQIVEYLNMTLTTTAPKLSLQLGEYAAFLSFFGLASLPSVSDNFTGIVNFASSMTFELVTNATVTGTAYPPVDQVSVRFLFANGSAADTPLMPYPLFGQSSLELPWTTFMTEMNKISVSGQADWCTACGNTSTGCTSTSTSVVTVTATPGATDSSRDNGISTAVGGVIGAMVTLAVILGIEALVLLLVGLRIVEKRSASPVVVTEPQGGLKA